MPLNDSSDKLLAEFYSAISAWDHTYTNSSFLFVALRDADHFEILQGALWLSAEHSAIPLSKFASENVLAGHLKLADLGMDYQRTIGELLSGKLKTPMGELRFSPVNGQSYHSLTYLPVHPSTQTSQRRLNVVRLGGDRPTVEQRQPLLDWELRAASEPFDSLADLLQAYNLGALFGDVKTIEIIATPVMIVADSSTISGAKASIDIQAASTCDTSNASVGFNIYSTGKVVRRGLLSTTDFAWERAPDKIVGRATLDVPPGAVVHCFANYCGLTQAHWWVADPTTAQNSRRTVYESFDGELAVLKEFLTRSNTRGRDARDLETAIAWLFWMLGFSIVHLGSTGRTQDAADLILVAPSGNFAVVECTTGILRTDSKLPLLIARTERVRKRLEATTNRHLKVMPIMITTLTREEIRADIEEAERLGVLVLARDFLDQAVTTTAVVGKPDELYAQAEKAIAERLAKFASPQQLPAGQSAIPG
jgi:hypothetical protein